MECIATIATTTAADESGCTSNALSPVDDSPLLPTTLSAPTTIEERSTEVIKRSLGSLKRSKSEGATPEAYHETESCEVDAVPEFYYRRPSVATWFAQAPEVTPPPEESSPMGITDSSSANMAAIPFGWQGSWHVAPSVCTWLSTRPG